MAFAPRRSSSCCWPLRRRRARSTSDSRLRDDGHRVVPRTSLKRSPTTRDYLWRWDTRLVPGAPRQIGAQHPALRRAGRSARSSWLSGDVPARLMRWNALASASGSASGCGVHAELASRTIVPSNKAQPNSRPRSWYLAGVLQFTGKRATCRAFHALSGSGGDVHQLRLLGRYRSAATRSSQNFNRLVESEVQRAAVARHRHRAVDSYHHADKAPARPQRYADNSAPFDLRPDTCAKCLARRRVASWDSVRD